MREPNLLYSCCFLLIYKGATAGVNHVQIKGRDLSSIISIMGKSILGIVVDKLSGFRLSGNFFWTKSSQ